MSRIRKTYIACWNPNLRAPYAVEQHIADLWRLKLWQTNHDVRWRASIEGSIDGYYDHPRGSIYMPQFLQSGDRMFVLRTGAPNPKESILLYSAFYDSNPFKKEDWRKNGQLLYYMRFQHDVSLHPLFPSKFTCQYLQHRFPNYQWAGNNRGFILADEDALALEKEWYDFFSKYDNEFTFDGSCYCQSPTGFRSMYEWEDEDGHLEHGQAWCYMEHLKEQLNTKR